MDQRPKSNEVLVKVHAITLQYQKLRITSNGSQLAHGSERAFTYSDIAGEIVAVGEDVEEWREGDRVCAILSTNQLHGGANPATPKRTPSGRPSSHLMEYGVFPVYSIAAFPMHLSYEEASTLPRAALAAYNALLGPVPVKGGDYVLILGLGNGGVSIFALQIAVASGASVIAASSDEDKLRIATRLGATHLVNYNATPNWDLEVLKITNGTGVDHIVEVGGHGPFLRAINAIRAGGSIHIIGAVMQDNSAKAELVRRTTMKGIIVRGIQVGSIVQFASMARLIKTNPEKMRPLLDRVFAVGETQEARDYLESQAHVGNVVIKVSSE